MSVFFSWLVSTSSIASITVCIILITKGFFKHRLSARWHYFIWFLLVARLALPNVIISPFSIFNIYNFLRANAGKPIDPNTLQASFNNTMLYKDMWNPLEDYTLSVSNGNIDWVISVLFFIWIIGVIYTLIFTLKAKGQESGSWLVQ